MEFEIILSTFLIASSRTERSKVEWPGWMAVIDSDGRSLAVQALGGPNNMHKSYEFPHSTQHNGNSNMFHGNDKFQSASLPACHPK